MGARAIDQNPNAIRAKIAALHENLRVTVGIQGPQVGQADSRGTTIGDLAAIHEFGDSRGRIPVRSWLRGWFDARQAATLAAIRKGYEQVLAGKITVRQLADAIGVRAVAEIQTRWVQRGTFVENAPSTIARKGSSMPLIDTGVLRAAVTFVVHPSAGKPSGGVSG